MIPSDEITDSATIADWIAHKLDRLVVDSTGWIILYRHRGTGQRWELSYPRSEMHGGGPPLLRRVPEAIPKSESA